MNFAIPSYTHIHNSLLQQKTVATNNPPRVSSILLSNLSLASSSSGDPAVHSTFSRGPPSPDPDSPAPGTSARPAKRPIDARNKAIPVAAVQEPLQALESPTVAWSRTRRKHTEYLEPLSAYKHQQHASRNLCSTEASHGGQSCHFKHASMVPQCVYTMDPVSFEMGLHTSYLHHSFPRYHGQHILHQSSGDQSV
jgi:hypothetical protein